MFSFWLVTHWGGPLDLPVRVAGQVVWGHVDLLKMEGRGRVSLYTPILGSPRHKGAAGG